MMQKNILRGPSGHIVSQILDFRTELSTLRKKKVFQQILRSMTVVGLSISTSVAADLLPSEDKSNDSPSTLQSKSQIRKRTDKYAEMDRKASLSHYEKLRNEGASKGFSDLNNNSSISPNGSNKSESTLRTESDKSYSSPIPHESSIAPASYDGRVLHVGPCSPCELASEYPIDATYQSSPIQSIPSPSVKPSPAPLPSNIKASQSDSPTSRLQQSVQQAAATTTTRPSKRQQANSQSSSTLRKEFDKESTTKPSLPSSRAISPAPTARKRSNSEPIRIGSLGESEFETLREEDSSSAPARVTLLPPPTISPITPTARPNVNASSDEISGPVTRQDLSSEERRYRLALPAGRSLTSVSTNSLEPLRIGSLSSALETSDYKSGFATQSLAQSPSILDQEAMTSPSLSASSPPFGSQPLSSPSDGTVVPAAFQSGAPFGVPPSSLNGSGVVQPSLPPPGINAPIYPSTPTYSPPPVSNQIYPAPPVTGPSTSSVPGLTPQSSYGLPSYPSQRSNTITSGEPFVTAAPRQFDACYMVEPTYANAGCGAPPLANTPPYSGIPGTIIPPTYMPNQVPAGLYPQGNSGYRPLIGFGQQNYNVQLGRGIFGQPKAYVPGQYVRNFLRYFTL